MTFLEAMQAVHQDPGKMAKPVGDYPDGLMWDRENGWVWAGQGEKGYRKAGLVHPILLFGEWEVVEMMQ